MMHNQLSKRRAHILEHLKTKGIVGKHNNLTSMQIIYLEAVDLVIKTHTKDYHLTMNFEFE